MLVVAKAGSEDAVKEILTKWELEAEEIGPGYGTMACSGCLRETTWSPRSLPSH